MLKVSLHSCAVADITPRTRIGFIDIAYVTLEPIATYKAQLFANGIAAVEEVAITAYPRWSDSLFDLVLRAIVLSLWRKEELVLPPFARGCAFAKVMSVVIEHAGKDGPVYRRRLGTLEIRMERTRGRYTAVMVEDIVGERHSPRFSFTPKVLTPWSLAACAIAYCLTGTASMPARPALILPPSLEEGGKPIVAIGHLLEPARTGFQRWLARERLEPTVDVEDTPGYVPEQWYARFLYEAV